MNLESELYAVAKSLAKAEDCTISVAVNQLLRRSLMPKKHDAKPSRTRSSRNGVFVSRGRKPITADLVQQIEIEDET